MIICPKCSTGLTELSIRGPVLFAEGVVEVNPDDNKLIAISPLKATTTVAVGTEVMNVNMAFGCRGCGYEGRIDTFRIASSCIITGQPTEFSIESEFGTLFVREDLAQEALRIFQLSKCSFQSNVSMKELLNV